MIIEAIGYIGSLLVVASMLMTSVMKLRIINTIGSSIFAIYALLIHSYPTALINLTLVSINLYNMRKLVTASSPNYSLVEEEGDSLFLQYFLQRNRQDIQHFFPEFRGEDGNKRAYLVCCADTPVGVLLGETTKSGGLEFALDYTTPAYRDCSVGAFLYRSLAEKGIIELIYTGELSKHEAYLIKMGFEMRNGNYVKTLVT